MRLLLDTHIILALVERRSSVLGPAIEAALVSGRHDLFASVASLWEIVIKWRSGRLNVSVPPDDIPAFLDSLGVAVLPIGVAHVLASHEPSPPTRDPFDRLYLSICRSDGLALVTVDHALTSHPLAWRP